MIPLSRDELATEDIRRLVATNWRLKGCVVEGMPPSMNSRTWLVTCGRERWVAKAVPAAAQPQFPGGMQVAALVAAAGVLTGAPRADRTGRLCAEVDGWFVALLSFVEGAPLNGATAEEQRRIGLTLGLGHRALVGADVAESVPFGFIDLPAPHLDLEPWMRPSVTAALAAAEDLPLTSLTHGLLHTDPAPEAFRLGADGRCGLIDWDRAMVGPLMYDVASAVMYLGGPDLTAPFVDAYCTTAPIARDEIERSVSRMLRYRYAVQADYFARRIFASDLTGVASPDDNAAGLAHAQRGLLDSG